MPQTPTLAEVLAEGNTLDPAIAEIVGENADPSIRARLAIAPWSSIVLLEIATATLVNKLELGADGTFSLGTPSGASVSSGNGQDLMLGGASGGIYITPDGLIVVNLPTTNPAIAGALWNDAGIVKVSAG